MIRPSDKQEFQDILSRLGQANSALGGLAGLEPAGSFEALTEQIIDSLRRNRYVEHLRTVTLSDKPLDPGSGLFDPVRAAIILQRKENLDEAYWMIFLYTHFGKNRRSGYGYARDVYGALGAEPYWTWARIRQSVPEFRDWLEEHRGEIRSNNTPGGFGNHRKYESLGGWSDKGTGAVVESYVDWVGDRGHVAKFAELVTETSNGEDVFAALDEAMKMVYRFGRTARFDYLMMASKVGLLDARPTHAHLRDATGPKKGVQLLLSGTSNGKASTAELDRVVAQLEAHLHVGFDVLEDAICNWQKSPQVFKPFRG